MIVDTSAILAIVIGEDGWERFADILIQEEAIKISAGNWIELSAVMTRRADPVIDAAFARLFRNLPFRILPVSARQAEIGHAAYREYGRGTGHSAYLNFGDCFAYALAKETGEPLLFKGDDFIHTDITPALPRS